MRYFFYKLYPPRPGFMSDMTAAETKLMQAHALYWRGLMDKGLVLAFGPVADPKGGFGIAVVRVEDGADVHSLADNDPVIKTNAGFRFELHPMPKLLYPGA